MGMSTRLLPQERLPTLAPGQADRTAVIGGSMVSPKLPAANASQETWVWLPVLQHGAKTAHWVPTFLIRRSSMPSGPSGPRGLNFKVPELPTPPPYSPLPRVVQQHGPSSPTGRRSQSQGSLDSSGSADYITIQVVDSVDPVET